MTVHVIASVEDAIALVGTPLGPSRWHTITQAMIDHFAEATDNHSPNHTDPVYAASTPAGTTIAFGMQILGLATLVLMDMWELRNITGGADYGYNRVRHLAPVPVGSQVRATATFVEAVPVDGEGVRLTTDLVFELEGEARPACIAQIVNVLWFGAP